MRKDFQNSNGVFRLCLRFLPYVFHRWKGLIVVLTTMLLKNSMQVLKPLPMMILVDHVLSQKPLSAPLTAFFVGILPGADSREGLLVWMVTATILIFFLEWGLDLASAYSKIGFGQQMVYDLAGDLYAHLQRLSIRYHSRKSIGDIIRRVTTDASSISTIVNNALLPVPVSLFTLISMFIVMWQLNTTLTLLALLVVPFLIITVHLYSKPMNELSYHQNEAEGEIYSVIERSLSALPIIQAFNLERQNERKLKVVTDKALQATLESNKIQVRYKLFTGLATAAGTSVILWVGGAHVLDGRLSVGNILVFISYLASLYGPLEMLMYSSMTVNNAAGSARRVLEVLDTDREVEDIPDAKALPEVSGHWRFENVSFGYEGDLSVLKDISFETLPGQTIAIVGPTGAGKSTLVSLIPRFFDPSQGKVSVDGIDLRDIRLSSLRSHIGIVLQEAFLFPVTVSENIAYGKPDSTSEEIEAAARAANAHQFIERLPEGYDTIIGERGATLSGGERQRLSIARALLKDAPVLILDEPTSSLDAQSEKLLIEALERLMKGRTTFIIAHRLSSIRKADTILVMDRGQIVERGTHQELIMKKGLYCSLYETQFALIIDKNGRDVPLTVTK